MSCPFLSHTPWRTLPWRPFLLSPLGRLETLRGLVFWVFWAGFILSTSSSNSLCRRRPFPLKRYRGRMTSYQYPGAPIASSLSTSELWLPVYAVLLGIFFLAADLEVSATVHVRFLLLYCLPCLFRTLFACYAVKEC